MSGIEERDRYRCRRCSRRSDLVYNGICLNCRFDIYEEVKDARGW